MCLYRARVAIFGNVFFSNARRPPCGRETSINARRACNSKSVVPTQPRLLVYTTPRGKRRRPRPFCRLCTNFSATDFTPARTARSSGIRGWPERAQQASRTRRICFATVGSVCVCVCVCVRVMSPLVHRADGFSRRERISKISNNLPSKYEREKKRPSIIRRVCFVCKRINTLP